MSTPYKAIWIDNSSRDPGATKAFYAGLFGWEMVTNEDPMYGGYALAMRDGKEVAGFGGQQDPNMPASNWNLYISTPDAAATVAAATAAGGTVIVPPFPIGTMGTSSFIADPSGAVFGLWQAGEMGGFQATGVGAYAWGEVTARGIDKAIPFYEQTFGWTHRTGDVGNGTMYTEFLDGDTSLLGGLEMPAVVSAEVPSYWQIYIGVEDVATTHAQALAAGAREMMPSTTFPGGTFSILADPLGGVFGLLKMG